jgi:hypothetical protein
VTDILKGLTGGGWAGLSAWIFPSALVLGIFWLFVYPHSGVKYPLFDSLSVAEQTAVWIAAALTIGLLFNAISTPMYRLLEGYSWPQQLREYGVARQRSVKAKLSQNVGGEGWRSGLEAEKLARFPATDAEIAPTRLGNAMRAFETYGVTRFELDSQVLWTELSAVVPKYLQIELDRSRANVDFFVALFYLSAAFGFFSLVAMFGSNTKATLVAGAVVAFSSMRIWYSMAVESTSYWSSTVRALVNIGRAKLADEMGLELPDSIVAERRMWWLVVAHVYKADPDAAQELDRYRKHKPTASSVAEVDAAEPQDERDQHDQNNFSS